MITGMHLIFRTEDLQETYAFFRDTLRLPSYDAGGGFLIFEPPAVEIGCEQTDPSYDISFFCDNIVATMRELEGRGVKFGSPIREEIWGRVTDFARPDGRSVMLYERKYSKVKSVGPA